MGISSKPEKEELCPSGSTVKEPVPMPEIPLPEIPKPVFTRPVIPPPEAPDTSALPGYRKKLLAALNGCFCVFCFLTPYFFGFSRSTAILILAGVLALPFGFMQKLWTKLFSARADFFKLVLLAVIFLAALGGAIAGNAAPPASAAASAQAAAVQTVPGLHFAACPGAAGKVQRGRAE